MAVEQFVISVYSAIVSWTFVLYIILLIVKVVQFFSSSPFGGGGGENGGGGGSAGDNKPAGKSPSGRPESKRQKRLREEKEKFTEGMENPAYLKVWVRNLDDMNVQGAIVTVKPLKFKKNISYKNHPTNEDGMAPSDGGSFIVPSQYTVIISVRYKLGKYEKYRSKKHMVDVGSLELIKRRTIKKEERVMLEKGKDEHVQAIQLDFTSEKNLGFEPYADPYEIHGDQLKLSGEIQSNTHGMRVK